MGIYIKEIKSLSQEDICTLMFMAALFTTAKTETKYPSADEWIKTM